MLLSMVVLSGVEYDAGGAITCTNYHWATYKLRSGYVAKSMATTQSHVDHVFDYMKVLALAKTP